MSMNTSSVELIFRAGKTVLFFDRFPAPSERFLHREVAGLAEMGCRVEIAALTRDFSLRMPTAIRGVWGNDYAPIDRLRAWFSASYWSALFTVLFSLGLPQALFLLFRPSAFGRFRKAMKGVCAVHSMHAGYCGLAAWALARLLGVPFSFSCHAHDVFVQRRILAFLLPRASSVIVCSKAAKKFIADKYPSLLGKINLVHHPAPVLELRDKAHVIPERIVAVGRNVQKKDFTTLFAAFSIVKTSFPNATLVICGADREEFASLPPGVVPMGMLPFNEVVTQLARAQLLAYSSAVTKNGDRDGIPNAIVEAMKLGVPVVAADAGGISEVVVAGETGRLIPAGDASAMAQAICDILHGGDEVDSMVSAARAKVDAEFNPRIQLERLAKAIGLEMQNLQGSK